MQIQNENHDLLLAERNSSFQPNSDKIINSREEMAKV